MHEMTLKMNTKF